MFRAMWKDFETKFGGVLDRLSRHRAYIESCAAVAQIHQSKKDLLEFRSENEARHQQSRNAITDLQIANLAQHQHSRDSITDLHMVNLGQHQQTHDAMKNMQTTGLTQHQQSHDAIRDLQSTNFAQHQQSRDAISDLQALNSSQHELTRNDIAQVQATGLVHFQTYETNIALLQSTTQTTQAMSQKHDADLARIEANNTARHKVYLEEMAELTAKMNATIAEERRKKMATVKDWLAVGQQNRDFHTSYRDIRSEYPNTTQWILRHDAVQEWVNSVSPSTPNLWINGIPGAGMLLFFFNSLEITLRLIPIGKTILASAIIDMCTQNPVPATCFFYCRQDDLTSSSPTGIIKGLVDQLLDQHPDLLPSCYSKRTTSGEPVLRSLSIATKMLEEFCLTLDHIYIVIDGLDECSHIERRQVLDTLSSIVSQCDVIEAGKLRLLIVSQDYVDIRRAFGSGNNKMAPKVIQISNKDNESDIEVYVKSWVDKIAAKFELSDDITAYLINLTVVNAKGCASSSFS